jgi:Fur family ferric uptake transcriptional regulator/Fur family peroxide stress response transcriptional regulator
LAKRKKSELRDRILELLKSTGNHPTAAWVFDKLRTEFPRVAVGTVYRNLNILVSEGLVKMINFNEPIERYDGNLLKHYHFICEQCGTIQDLDIPPLKSIENRIEKQTGMDVTHHRIDFYGICPTCKRRSKGEAKG